MEIQKSSEQDLNKIPWNIAKTAYTAKNIILFSSYVEHCA